MTERDRPQQTLTPPSSYPAKHAIRETIARWVAGAGVAFVILYGCDGNEKTHNGQPGSKTEKPSLKGTPTDESTGPRSIPKKIISGKDLTGEHSGVYIKGQVEVNNSLNLSNCVIVGGMRVVRGTVKIDHCDINGWFGVRPENDEVRINMSNVKLTGSTNNDAVGIGNFDSKKKKRIKFFMTDSIIHSPYQEEFGDHFDLVQFGKGSEGSQVTFTNVVFSYRDKAYNSDRAVNYINNKEAHAGVILDRVLITGGKVNYVFDGPMTVRNSVIDNRSFRGSYIYPKAKVNLINVIDQEGTAIHVNR